MAEIDRDMNGYKITHLTRDETELTLEALIAYQGAGDDTLTEIINALDDILRNGRS